MAELKADIWVDEPSAMEPNPIRRLNTSKPPVTDIQIWLECYEKIAGLLSMRYPDKAPELWAYQSTILRAAHNYEGANWVCRNYNDNRCRFSRCRYTYARIASARIRPCSAHVENRHRHRRRARRFGTATELARARGVSRPPALPDGSETLNQSRQLRERRWSSPCSGFSAELYSSYYACINLQTPSLPHCNIMCIYV